MYSVSRLESVSSFCVGLCVERSSLLYNPKNRFPAVPDDTTVPGAGRAEYDAEPDAHESGGSGRGGT